MYICAAFKSHIRWLSRIRYASMKFDGSLSILVRGNMSSANERTIENRTTKNLSPRIKNSWSSQKRYCNIIQFDIQMDFFSEAFALECIGRMSVCVNIRLHRFDAKMRFLQHSLQIFVC